MSSFNRRQWLQLAGYGSLATLLTPGAAASTPSHFAKAEELIRLSSNENPYGPSQRVREAMIASFDKVCRYPSRYQQELKEMVAKKHGLTTAHVLLVAGSTEGLKLCGLTYGAHGKEIVAADPVFKALTAYAAHFGSYIHQVPVGADLQHDLEAMDERITQNTGLVFVCNPNNPTGTILPAEKMKSFCSSVSERTLVFSDEAYFDYIEIPNYPSMTELVKKGDNVVVSRTFSKVYGLAGIRIGYLLARPDIIQRLGQSIMARPNMLAIFAAVEAMKDEDFYKMSLAKNKEGKAMIYQTLQELGLEYVPSHTNFVFFKTGKDIREIQAAIRAEGVLVGRAFPPLRDWCRVSTGTTQEVEMLCKAMKKVLS